MDVQIRRFHYPQMCLIRRGIGRVWMKRDKARTARKKAAATKFNGHDVFPPKF
jgi:hypothetical protein